MSIKDHSLVPPLIRSGLRRGLGDEIFGGNIGRRILEDGQWRDAMIPARVSRVPGFQTGFTILELLVATAILAMLLVLVFSAISQATAVWRRSMDKIESFKGSRLAFESITQKLSQATLNTYLDYDYDTNNNPVRYVRQSELKFRSGAAGGDLPGTADTGSALFFEAPAGYTSSTNYSGMESLLNTCGYFVSFTTNRSLPAHVAASGNAYRYRLMQLLVPAESNKVYSSADWFASQATLARPIADNVIALIVRPYDPGANTNTSPNNQYAYDSTSGAGNNPQPITANQLPPVVQVTMVAIDEVSALRLENGTTAPSAISSALSGKFLDRSSYESNLNALTTSLSANGINYRVFSSAVPIRESKWTK